MQVVETGAISWQIANLDCKVVHLQGAVHETLNVFPKSSPMPEQKDDQQHDDCHIGDCRDKRDRFTWQRVIFGNLEFGVRDTGRNQLCLPDLVCRGAALLRKVLDVLGQFTPPISFALVIENGE